MEPSSFIFRRAPGKDFFLASFLRALFDYSTLANLKWQTQISDKYSTSVNPPICSSDFNYCEGQNARRTNGWYISCVGALWSWCSLWGLFVSVCIHWMKRIAYKDWEQTLGLHLILLNPEYNKHNIKKITHTKNNFLSQLVFVINAIYFMSFPTSLNRKLWENFCTHIFIDPVTVLATFQHNF